MEIQSLIRSRTFKMANLLLWSLLFFLSWLRIWAPDYAYNWQNIVYWPGAYYFMLFLLSPMVFFSFLSTLYLRLNKLIVRHLVFSLLFGITHFIATGFSILLLERLFKVREHYNISSLLGHFYQNWFQLFDGAGWYIFLFVVLSMLRYFGLYHEERKELERAKSELINSNLQLLSTQLSPHFLFNAMNNITMMVRKEENKKAVSMIAALSEMLRMAMTKHNKQLVSLHSEINILKKYVMLEKERYKDRVEVIEHYDEKAMNASVPRLILQPLVENAFKHGAANNIKKTIVRISTQREGDRLLLSVYNSGQIASHWDINSAESIGLPNTVHRLRQMYESNFVFKVIEQEEGVLFQISLPFLHL